MFGYNLPAWVGYALVAFWAVVSVVVVLTSSSWWRWSLGQRHFWFQRRRKDAMIASRLYEAKRGQGKTVNAVKDVVRFMRQGHSVASNVVLRDPKTGQSAIPCASWVDMLRIAVEHLERKEPILFFIDEVPLWADARDFKDIPTWFHETIAQLRHLGGGTIATCQALSQVEKRFRLMVDELYRVKPLLPFYGHFGAFVITQAEVTGSDGMEVVEYAERGGLSWCPGWAFHAYSTNELVQGTRFSDYDTPEVKAEVELLRLRAQAAIGEIVIPAFPDRLGELSTVAASGAAAAVDNSSPGGDRAQGW